VTTVTATVIGGRHSTESTGRVFKNKRTAGATIVRGRRSAAEREKKNIIKTIFFFSLLPLRARSRPTSSDAAAALAALRDIGGSARGREKLLHHTRRRKRAIPEHAARVLFRVGVRARLLLLLLCTVYLIIV